MSSHSSNTKMGMIDEFFLNQYIKKPNRIRVFQEFFQKGSNPVFLKTKADVLVYRSTMAASVLGLGVSFYFIGLMALGKMKKTSS